MKHKSIFISYSWKDKHIADKVYQDLTFVGINVLKDSQALKYTDRISEFMKKIGKCKFTLVILTEDYIKSFNCMTEMMLLQDNKNSWKSVLPVVDRSLSIYNPIDRLKFVEFWQTKCEEFQLAISKLEKYNVAEANEELLCYRRIASTIDSFLICIKDMINCSPEDLFNDFYQPIIDKIGIEPDFTKMVELLPISMIKNPEERLKALEIYTKKHQVENSYYYAFLGTCYRDLGQKKKSVIAFKKAIHYDKYNFTAWNNLGQLYEVGYRNYDEAKVCYEQAIVANPDLDIPRLNLGVLLSNHYKNDKEAIIQYLEIIKTDECNSKAHNNLANIYRHGEYLDNEKAERHLLIAAAQNLPEALINYGNFLKTVRGNSDLGNQYYERAKEQTKDSDVLSLINSLLATSKG